VGRRVVDHDVEQRARDESDERRGGASAADVAAEFDLAKSTVSEHLRTVTAVLFSQTFGDGI